jgi:anti-sigma B factor antagonist
MTISERQVGTVTILDISGGLKLEDGATELGAAVRRLLDQGRTALLLNVAGVPFVDSAGLGALVQGYVSASRAPGALKLLNTPRRLRELLVITKLAGVLPSFDDEREAIASFTGRPA